MGIPRVRFTVRQMMIGVVILAVILFVGLRVVERQRQLNKAAHARYAASLALYHGTERLFRGGEVGVQQVYDHSRIVLEAQREMGDSAWASDHLGRMRALAKLLNGLPGDCCCDRPTRNLIDYAVKEAEFWALRDAW
jgi:hypothetical protein